MILNNILSQLMIERKELDVKKLPSQGLFYPDGFKLKIKKAEIEDILDYEQKIDRSDMIKSIECIKKIVERNVTLNKNWSYLDLKSVDIIFIFIEIVKFTQSKELMIDFLDNSGITKKIAFSSENFFYFDYQPFLEFYDSETKEFVIDGWRYSFPSIGVENALSRYLTVITDSSKIEKMKKISYNFLFFLTGKNILSYAEIDNLIQIFNNEITEAEKNKVNEIVSLFSPVLSYALRYDGMRIEIKSKVNIETIWHL